MALNNDKAKIRVLSQCCVYRRPITVNYTKNREISLIETTQEFDKEPNYNYQNYAPDGVIVFIKKFSHKVSHKD